MVKTGLIANKSAILSEFSQLSAPKISKSTPIPGRIDRRDEMLPSSNQGTTSQCAAYSIAGIIESLLWRDTGKYEQINPAPIYAEAKRIDGSPNTQGTTLNAVFYAAQRLGLIERSDEVYAVTDRNSLYRALHRYGFVLCGLNITEAWSHAAENGWLADDSRQSQIGGHAVVCNSYDKDSFVGFQNSWGTRIGADGHLRLTNKQFDRQFMYGLAWK